MRTKILIPLSALLLIGCIWYFNSNTVDPLMPMPTNGETIVKLGSEEGDNQAKREAWFELMHSTAPGTNWKAIEYETSMKRHENRALIRQNAAARGDEEILANGNLVGEWYERGSLNQAGSVFVTEYDPITDEIWLVSAGGTLFKGTRQGNDWEVINQDLRLGNNLLKFIETQNGRRMVAIIGDKPHYSDDDGVTWVSASGVPVSDGWAECIYPVVMDDVDNDIYFLSKSSYWEDYKIYKSSDNGETYTSIATLNSYIRNNFKMVRPHHSDEIYLIEKNGDWSTIVYRINQEDDILELVVQNDDFGFQEFGRANLAAIQVDTITRFVAYKYNQEIFQSDDLGVTWNYKGDMPSRPWSVGLFISPTNPDVYMYGEVECLATPDAGATWTKINNWWDYYNNVNGMLHADMMYFNEFETSTGEPFLLISNHGGLNITYDLFGTVDNLGLTNLNVSQYYDVVTDPTDPVYMYAGSQDQGFQRSLAFDNTTVAEFDQVISGDYGHIVFSENGNRMWTVYPGGWVTYYHLPQTGGIAASWEVNSDDETVWIPPLMSSPDPEENAIYMAGGNMEGGSGSYLIKLEYNSATQSIDTSQIDYDFYDFSVEGTIAMMRTSPVNPDHWYVSTTNGRFFYSYDGGLTWDQSIQFIPGGHYLYGSTIYPSKLDSSIVYFGGSGYDNPAVYKSTDGGQTFEAMNDGMPSTLVFELTANQDETMFFAATEAGPYVYVVADELWYDMSGMAAPNQTYWSVEYINELDIVRFGTYGRGIWDFQVMNEVSTQEVILNNDALKVYPNPTQDIVNINLEETLTDKVSVEISDLNGRVVKVFNFDVLTGQTFQEQLSLKGLPKASYILTLRDGKNLSSKQIIVQ